jgi:hypothetical protein
MTKIHGNTTHGKTSTAEYRIWRAMKERCSLPSNKHWADYGGRGIRVCTRWRDSFENFYADMGPRPSHLHSIDRKENDVGYQPDNCRWVTATVQANNRRTRSDALIITMNGKTMTVSAWERAAGVTRVFFRQRIRRGGMSPEEALTKPHRVLARRV